jgi:hypothetical protein
MQNKNKSYKYKLLSNKVILAATAAKTQESTNKLMKLYMYYRSLSNYYSTGDLRYLSVSVFHMNERIREWHCYKGVN